MIKKTGNMYPILNRIESPADLRSLNIDDLYLLAREIRLRIIETVDANGGHLGSNLGVVELTIALHIIFDMCQDRLLWDVSHQVYAHKLLTGRAKFFSELRCYGGLSGFSNKRESPFDLFEFGHAGTAISVASGVSVADKLSGRSGKTVVVIGDASCGCGISFEGLNHAGGKPSNLLVILNDNRMSISNSVGALSFYLQRIRKKPFWKELVDDIRRTLIQIPLLGRQCAPVMAKIHEVVKNSILPGLVFQELGFKYFGPVNGHDLPELLKVLKEVQSIQEPVLLHIHTIKGKGFEPAAANPTRFHGCRNFLPANGNKCKKKNSSTYTKVFSDTLCRLGKKNSELCAVTAAMADGTGVTPFLEEHPERTFDVGIAEEHGACFSSGLSFGGKPVIYVVYSTFAQRAYDQVFHEICLQYNKIVICLDRAGIVGEDGATHHGVFDIALFRHLPAVVLAAPRDGPALRKLLEWSLSWPQPVIIRYPKSTVPQDIKAAKSRSLLPGHAEIIRRGTRVLVFAYGSMVREALVAADKMLPFKITVVDARFAKPVDMDLLKKLSKDHDVLVTVEEHVLSGGFGSAVLEGLNRENIQFKRVVCLGIPDVFVKFGTRDYLLSDLSLTGDGIYNAIQKTVQAGGRLENKKYYRRNVLESGVIGNKYGHNSQRNLIR